MPFYNFNTSSSADWMSRILWRNETALWFNGPHKEHGRMDFRADLGKITCPALVMVGHEDPITPPEFSDEIAAGLRPELCTYLKFAECGHGVVGDKPDEALRALRGFIGSVQS